MHCTFSESVMSLSSGENNVLGKGETSCSTGSHSEEGLLRRCRGESMLHRHRRVKSHAARSVRSHAE